MCAPVKWRLAGMLPREWRKCTLSAELILNPMTGEIIHCEALLISVGKALYKNSYYYYYYMYYYLYVKSVTAALGTVL